MSPLAPGWYIVLYHDISWEENCYMRGIGGTIPPDVFRDHLDALASMGDVVAVAEGERRWRTAALDGPVFSLWFDDGLAGVAKHAAPILDRLELSAAASICSRFVNRAEFFWRCKLSYLSSIDGLRFVRSHLRPLGFTLSDSVKEFTLANFSPALLERIDELFVRFTTPEQRNDAFRGFMDGDDVRALSARGWTIANHGAAHHPVNRPNPSGPLRDAFEECEREIESITGQRSDHWVLPFDRQSADALAAARDASGDRRIVVVDERVNTPRPTDGQRTLYRISAPVASAAKLTDKLERLGR